jgi:ribosomal protein S6--L-glutamate ligase
MPRTLAILNGGSFWEGYFPDLEVYSLRLQDCRWLLENNQLRAFDSRLGKAVRVDSLLWRIGATRPLPNYQAILQLVRAAKIPCLNSAQTLLRCEDRLTMLTELQLIGLPVVPHTVVIGPELMPQVRLQLPAVIKIGSYHAGYGKMLLETYEAWQDMQDLIFVTQDYFTIEPFWAYKCDIRCLAVGEQVWAMARQGSRLKANSGVVESQLIPAPPVLYDYTLRAWPILKLMYWPWIFCN